MKKGKSIFRNLNSSWLLLGANTISQLVQVPIALHFLDKEMFGLFALVSQFVSTLMLVELGMTSALTRLFMDGRVMGRDAYNRVWSSGLCIFGIQAVTLTTAVLCAAPFLTKFFKVPETIAHTTLLLFLIMGFYGVIRYVSNIYSIALVAGQRMDIMNNAGIVSVFLQFFIFLGALFLRAGVWSYVIANIVTLPVGILILRSSAIKHGLVGTFCRTNIHSEDLFRIFRLGLGVFVTACFNMFMTSSILLFGGVFLKLNEVAVLAVNLKLPILLINLFQRIPGSADPVLGDCVSRNNLERFRFGWIIIVKVTLIVSLIGSGLYFLWSRIIISAWTSEDMVLPVFPTLLLALIPIRFILHYLMVMSLSAFKELRLISGWLIAEMFFATLLFVLLGRKYGLTGLLMANVLSIFTGSLWCGVRSTAQLSGIRVRHMASAVGNSLAIPGAFLAVMCTLYTPTNHIAEIPFLVVVTFLWLIVSGFSFWLISVNLSERIYLKSMIWNPRHQQSL